MFHCSLNPSPHRTQPPLSATPPTAHTSTIAKSKWVTLNAAPYISVVLSHYLPPCQLFCHITFHHIGFIQAFLGAFTKLWKQPLVLSCLAVHLYFSLHGTTCLPLDGISWNLVFEELKKKICQGNSSIIKIWQEQWVLDVKTYVCLWWYWLNSCYN